MRRAAAAVLTGAMLALGACSPEAEDPTADCTDQGSPPPGEPGAAEVLLTVGNDDGSSQLTAVLYADGWVLTLDGEDMSAVTALQPPMMAPTPPEARQWQPAYLGSCQLEEVTGLAAEELDQDQDLGDPQITDQASTIVTYYGGEQPATTRAYALGRDGAGLSSSDQAGREVLQGIITALAEAPSDGDLLEVETVQLISNGEVDLPPDWPGPPLADIIGDDEICGELTGQEAQEAFGYIADGGDIDALRLEVLPPGLPTCT
ncbi:MAG TPA: hypothetical protein H9815_13825 [Candidatus Ruania gallistercoris]|uniref:Secreted protein n=1 Tax=Candidatus Ruania gallistercoris TaxID=2838746 RepID=A0A9D2J516_9MICO|nr:hypothetical protein [Candidatus Ruania gallistercoris]